MLVKKCNFCATCFHVFTFRIFVLLKIKILQVDKSIVNQCILCYFFLIAVNLPFDFLFFHKYFQIETLINNLKLFIVDVSALTVCTKDETTGEKNGLTNKIDVNAETGNLRLHVSQIKVTLHHGIKINDKFPK